MAFLDFLYKDTLQKELAKKEKIIERRLSRKLEKVNSKTVQVFDAPIGYNRQITTIERPASSGIQFGTLRQFSVLYPIARACINHLKAKINKLDWDIAPLDDDSNEDDPNITTVKKFFENFGDSRTTFRSFTSAIVEDLEVLDAVAIYKRKTLGGKIDNYLPIDASTIKLLIQEDGSAPIPPDIAYQQIIRGTIAAELTADELIYDKMHPRTNSPYGLSPLESLIIIVMSALKSDNYNLAMLTEGNIPAGFIELPPEIANNPESVKTWQDYFDALVAGDPRFQNKLKALPSGTKYTATTKPEDMAFDKFSEWLMQVTCAVFGVPPQDLGFTMKVNKATAGVQQSIGEEKGMQVISLFLKEIFDRMIQTDLGFPNLQFVWTDLDPVDRKEEADLNDIQVRSGILSVDEIRVAQGLEPIGMSNAVYTATGPILLEQFLKEANNPNPSDVRDEQNSDQSQEEENQEENQEPAKEEQTETPAQETQEDQTEAEKADIRRWRKVVIKALKEGKETFKTFQSDKIHPALMEKINYDLRFVATEDAARAIFSQYISKEGEMLKGAFKLNAELNRLAENQAE